MCVWTRHTEWHFLATTFWEKRNKNIYNTNKMYTTLKRLQCKLMYLSALVEYSSISLVSGEYKFNIICMFAFSKRKMNFLTEMCNWFIHIIAKNPFYLFICLCVLRQKPILGNKNHHRHRKKDAKQNTITDLYIFIEINSKLI